MDGGCYTNGGRVLGITAVGNDLAQAVTRAYEGLEPIAFERAHFRSDIGGTYRRKEG